MAKFDYKRPGDEKTLEGGGGGGGGGSGKLSPLAYIPPAVGLGGMGFIKKKQIEIAQEAGDKDRREAKYEMKRETRGMAKGGSVSSAMYEDTDPTLIQTDSAEFLTKLSSEKPGKSSRYVGPNASKAGAGRGKQGGPTAKEMGMAKGGSVSARADGCAQRGKTKGRFV
jgi:hypothetical protein